MSTQARVYLMVAAELHGPFGVQEVQGMIAAGTLSDGKGTELAVTMSPGIGAPVGPATGLPSKARDASVPMSSVLVDLALALLFILGVILLVYYGLFFDTTRDGIHSPRLLNDRFVGVISGSALAVVVCLIKLVRKFPQKR